VKTVLPVQFDDPKNVARFALFLENALRLNGLRLSVADVFFGVIAAIPSFALTQDSAHGRLKPFHHSSV
jgi:hypothetical protein